MKRYVLVANYGHLCKVINNMDVSTLPDEKLKVKKIIDHKIRDEIILVPFKKRYILVHHEWKSNVDNITILQANSIDKLVSKFRQTGIRYNYILDNIEVDDIVYHIDGRLSFIHSADKCDTSIFIDKLL